MRKIEDERFEFWKDSRKSCPICDGGPNGYTLSCPVLGVVKPLDLSANVEEFVPSLEDGEEISARSLPRIK